MPARWEKEPINICTASKLHLLENQPARQEALPHVAIIGEKKDIFSPLTQQAMEISLLSLRNRNTLSSDFRAHLEFLTVNLLQVMVPQKYREIDIETTLGSVIPGRELDTRLAVFYINRAGSTMALAAARFLPKTTTAIGEFDIDTKRETMETTLGGFRLPNPREVAGREIMLLQPVIASGGAIECAIKTLRSLYGQNLTGAIKIGSIIMSPAGALEVKKNIPGVQMFGFAMDERLSKPGEVDDRGEPIPQGFILPGFGNAGDRQFGKGRTPEYQRIDEQLSHYIDWVGAGLLVQSPLRDPQGNIIGAKRYF